MDRLNKEVYNELNHALAMQRIYTISGLITVELVMEA